MKLLKKILASAVATALLAAPLASQAALVLELDDSLTVGLDKSIADGDLLDVNPLVGAITFVGSLGLWNLNVSTAAGSAQNPFFGVDLNTINNSQAGAGLLTVRMSENFLSFGDAPGTSLYAGGAIGGTTTGSVSYKLKVDDSNALFGGSTVWSGTSTGPAFAATGGAFIPLSDPFSLTLDVVIDHQGKGATSFDFSGEVPEPASIALMGLALFGLGVTSRRRKV